MTQKLQSLDLLKMYLKWRKDSLVQMQSHLTRYLFSKDPKELEEVKIWAKDSQQLKVKIDRLRSESMV